MKAALLCENFAPALCCLELDMKEHAELMAAALPEQVVNRLEVEAMGNVGVPFFGINLAVGLSLALPGFTTDMTKGLLGALPQVRLARI